MLKDADPKYFAGIYIVCGRTDLQYGIDSLAAIIERKYKVNLFVPNTLFLFCGRSATKIKGLLWEGDGYLLFPSIPLSTILRPNTLPDFISFVHNREFFLCFYI